MTIATLGIGESPGRSLLRLLRPARGRLLVAALAFVVKDSPFWILPIVTANIIDALVDDDGLAPIWINAAVGAGIIAVNFPANALYVRLYSGVVRQLGSELRNALAHRLQELSIGFHSRTNSSIVQTKVVRDVENLELMLQQTLGPMLSSVTIIIGAGVTTGLRAPAFLLVFALTVPVAVILVRWLRRRSGSRNEQFRRQVEGLSSRVGEMASLLPITRAHGLEQVAVGRVTQSARDVRDAGLALDRLNGRFGALSWMSYQFLGLACLVGAGAAAMTGLVSMSPGDVVLLSTYFTILTGSLTTLFGLAPVVTRGFESLRSMSEVLQDPDIERNEGKLAVAAVEGEIRFRQTSFGYEGDADDLALSDLDLTIARGETVAFVGPSGSGKSTLLNLALGFRRPTSGRIDLDGVDMEMLDLRSMRRFVSVVPQESVLFEGSIRDNITYGLKDVPDEQVNRALTDANAIDFVRALPEGLNTIVGERGSRISGGQRQRIAIARALIRDPRILLLDEATSALDPESERAVREALERLMRGRTTLVVAHRLSTVRSADRIVVLNHGRIVESGSHDALLSNGGLYSRLHSAQAG